MTTSAPGGPLAQRHVPPATPAARPRPPGTPDATVAALGKLSEALEAAEHARGLLYGFHRLCGTADRTLPEAVSMLRDAGQATLASDIEQTLAGRDAEEQARAEAGVPARHVFEAEMKAREQ